MAWCPKCQIETDGSTTFCPRCGGDTDAKHQVDVQGLRFQVLGILEGQGRSERTLVSRFSSRSEAEGCASFLRSGGQFLRVEIVDSQIERDLFDSTSAGKAHRKIRWKLVTVAACLAGVLIIPPLLSILFNQNRNPPPQQVAGPAAAIAPQQPPPAPVRAPLPDFSKVDYSVDFSTLDYAHGPHGEELIERPGPARVDQFPSVQHGFPRTAEDPSPADAAAAAAPEGENTDAATANKDRFVLHGAHTVFYPKGFGSAFAKEPLVEPRKHSEQFYFNGLRHGTYTEWNTDGTMLLRVPFKEGKKHGLLERWSVSGQKILEEPYLEGKRHGIVRAWHAEGGMLRMEGAWVAGKREGLLKEWSQPGEEQVTDWIDGEVVFHPGRSSSLAFIWKMKTSADAIRNDGQLIFRSVERFTQIFGEFTHFRELDGGRQQFYGCTDGQFGVILYWDGQGGCVIPMNFTYVR